MHRVLVAVLALVVCGAPGCRADHLSTEAPYRVALIVYPHETCTFCPGGDVTVDDWMRAMPLLSSEDVADYLDRGQGFVRQAQEYGDFELIGIRSPVAVWGGSSRSWNTRESFEHFAEMMIEDLEQGGPWDGVYLYLHGALAVRDVPRPEAELVRRVREVVGDNAPIAATFDLHGNEDGEFLRWADGAFVTKRFPHYDMGLQGERAAHFMHRMLTGHFRPAKATRKPPILTPTVLQWTGQSPAMDIMERARRWEAREDVFVSVFLGFPWSDVPDVGMTVHVMANGDQELADEVANDMAAYAWRVRERFAAGSFPQPGEAVDSTINALTSGGAPVVLGDYSDRPGDATWILSELVEKRVSRTAYLALRDENVLQELRTHEAKVGDSFNGEVGGFTGEHAGPPVRIQGTIRYVGPARGIDYVAAIEYGDGNLLVLAPTYTQVVTPEWMRFGPFDPENYDVFVVKSRVHFRRGFDETGFANTILVVDAPGSWFGTTRLEALDYQHVDLSAYYPFNKGLEYDPELER